MNEKGASCGREAEKSLTGLGKAAWLIRQDDEWLQEQGDNQPPPPKKLHQRTGMASAGRRAGRAASGRARGEEEEAVRGSRRGGPLGSLGLH